MRVIARLSARGGSRRRSAGGIMSASAVQLVKRLVVQGFKRVEGEVELELSGLTVLYGPNASGKSSILCALQRLLHYVYGVRTACPQEVNYSARTLRVAGLVWVPGGYVEVEYGAEVDDYRVTRRRWFRVGPLVAEFFEGSTYVKCGDRKISISFAPYVAEGSLFSREAVRSGGLLGDVLRECGPFEVEVYEHSGAGGEISESVRIERRRHALSWLRDAVVKHVKVDEGVYEEFGWRPLQYMAETLVRHVRPPATLGAVRQSVAGLAKYGVRALDKFKEDLGYVFGEEIIDIAIDVSVEPASHGGEEIIEIAADVELVFRGGAFKLRQLSDGMLHVVNTLAEAYSAVYSLKEMKRWGIEPPPPLLIIDTPEFNIHVDWLYRLMELLLDLGVQVIVETHSGLLLAYALKYGVAYYVKDGKVKMLDVKSLKDIELFRSEYWAYQQVT